MKGDLSCAITDAVSDYVRLRGLNNLCPDVKKWSPPPGPAAYLDAGLPKISGDASVPRGLLLASYPPATSKGNHGGGFGSTAGTRPSGAASKDNDCGISGSGNEMHCSGTSENYPCGENRRGGGGGGGGTQKGVGMGLKRSNSIPSPTWEMKGPEGFNSQVLSFDDDAAAEMVTVSADAGTREDGGNLGSGSGLVSLGGSSPKRWS